MTLIRTKGIAPSSIFLDNQCQSECPKTFELLLDGGKILLSPSSGFLGSGECTSQTGSVCHLLSEDNTQQENSCKFPLSSVAENVGSIIGVQGWYKSIQLLRAMVFQLNCMKDEISTFELPGKIIFPQECKSIPTAHPRNPKKKSQRLSEQHHKQMGERLRFESKTTAILISWLLKHLSNPYPSVQEKHHLANETGLNATQIQHWFINIRKRHLVPLKSGKRKPRSFLDFLICAIWSLDGKDTPVGEQVSSEEGPQLHQFSEAAASFLKQVQPQTFLDMSDEDSQTLLELWERHNAAFYPAMQLHP